MKKKNLFGISLILILLSVCIYALQILIFRDPKTTEFYFFQDMAFMPVTIAIATLVVGYMMEEHERKEKIERSKMLTSSFFTDMGRELLGMLLEACPEKEELIDVIAEGVETESGIREELGAIKIHIQLTKESAAELKRLLDEHQMMMLICATNPMLLEHEKFTDMLWAVFHLRDELKLRDISQLNEQNRRHLQNDAARVLFQLILNWKGHLQYVKKEYPYFYASTIEELEGRQ